MVWSYCPCYISKVHGILTLSFITNMLEVIFLWDNILEIFCSAWFSTHIVDLPKRMMYSTWIALISSPLYHMVGFEVSFVSVNGLVKMIKFNQWDKLSKCYRNLEMETVMQFAFDLFVGIYSFTVFFCQILNWIFPVFHDHSIVFMLRHGITWSLHLSPKSCTKVNLMRDSCTFFPQLRP